MAEADEDVMDSSWKDLGRGESRLAGRPRCDRSLDVGPLWQLYRGRSPLVAVALHAGHDLRRELLPYLLIDEQTRLREEDPYSDYWTQVAPNRVLPQRSRFEVDLNRPRDEAICARPEGCWGLQVWRQPLPEAMVSHSLAEHDDFYAEIDRIFGELARRYGHFLVFDLHSYNHRRGAPDAPPSDHERNPEINIGTGTLRRDLWGPLVERFAEDLRRFDYLGRHLDVRENVNFRGRYLAEHTHRHFPDSGCVLAIEVKKFFMDEWTGVADPRQVQALLVAFRSTLEGLQEELARL